MTGERGQLGCGACYSDDMEVTLLREVHYERDEGLPIARFQTWESRREVVALIRCRWCRNEWTAPLEASFKREMERLVFGVTP